MMIVSASPIEESKSRKRKREKEEWQSLSRSSLRSESKGDTSNGTVNMEDGSL